MAARILIKNEDNVNPGKDSGSYFAGNIVTVKNADDPLGGEQLPSVGKFLSLIVSDRESEELQYLKDPWTQEFTYEEISDTRTRFFADTVSVSGRFAMTTEKVDALVDKFNSQYGDSVTASRQTVAARQFVLSFSYSVPNTPETRTQVMEWFVLESGSVALQARRYTITQAGLDAIRAADNELTLPWAEASVYIEDRVNT